MSASTPVNVELHDSRAVSNRPDSRAYEQRFKVVGASGSTVAEDRVRLEPWPEEAAWDGRVEYRTEPEYFDARRPENSVFGVVRTKTWDGSDDEEWDLSISASESTTTTALRAVAAEGSVPLWNNEDGAGSPVNVRIENGRAQIAGMRVNLPTMQLSLSYPCAETEWKSRLRALVVRKRGMINSDEFKGFMPGELLFAGGRAVKERPGVYRVSYTFDVSPNGEYRAGDFVIPDAAGWDAKWALWVEDESEPETSTGTSEPEVTIPVPKCLGAYSSGTYLRTQFASLIPTEAIPNG